MAAFFVSSAGASDIQGYLVQVPIFCAQDGSELIDEARDDGMQIVWSKEDFGGGSLTLYMNIKTEEWSLLRLHDGDVCKVASNAKREAGT